MHLAELVLFGASVAWLMSSSAAFWRAASPTRKCGAEVPLEARHARESVLVSCPTSLPCTWRLLHARVHMSRPRRSLAVTSYADAESSSEDESPNTSSRVPSKRGRDLRYDDDSDSDSGAAEQTRKVKRKTSRKKTKVDFTKLPVDAILEVRPPAPGSSRRLGAQVPD